MKKKFNVIFISLLCNNIGLYPRPDTQIMTNEGNILTEINQSQNQHISSLVNQVRSIYSSRIELIQQVLNLYDDHKKVTVALKSSLYWLTRFQVYPLGHGDSEQYCYKGDEDDFETKDLTADEKRLIEACSYIVDEICGYGSCSRQASDHDEECRSIEDYRFQLKKDELMLLEVALLNAYVKHIIALNKFQIQERSDLNLIDNNEKEKIECFIKDLKEMNNEIINQLNISRRDDKILERIVEAYGQERNFTQKHDEISKLFNDVAKNRSRGYIDRKHTQYYLHFCKLIAENILKILDQEPISTFLID